MLEKGNPDCCWGMRVNEWKMGLGFHLLLFGSVGKGNSPLLSHSLSNFVLKACIFKVTHVPNTSFRAGWKEISFLKKAVSFLQKRRTGYKLIVTRHISKYKVLFFLACKNANLLIPLKLCHLEDSVEMKWKCSYITR